jgi:hypothetical protein
LRQCRWENEQLWRTRGAETVSRGAHWEAVFCVDKDTTIGRRAGISERCVGEVFDLTCSRDLIHRYRCWLRWQGQGDEGMTSRLDLESPGRVESWCSAHSSTSTRCRSSIPILLSGVIILWELIVRDARRAGGWCNVGQGIGVVWWQSAGSALTKGGGRCLGGLYTG